MYKDKGYFDGLFSGLKSIGIGLKTTMREFFTKKITEQYPENRKELEMFDRFRGSLTMPHNENNQHKCVACGLCQMACPNDSINVISEMKEVDGKKKKVLVTYEYNLGSCMFCMLCVNACPHGAITFDQSFENAVFDRSKLIKVLNQPGSSVIERPKPAPRSAVAKPTAPVAEKPAPAAERPAPQVAEEAKPATPAAEKPLVQPAVDEKPSTPVVEKPMEKPSPADKGINAEESKSADAPSE
ncbi:4Fe-4S dicluster domain-containing protein [Pseudoprevotella muciniphila]|uniref:4Fe-4S dicluster domain-containing protein n=1 Tax=Pseudoprevotella muciniphila TaxID=2133944 RepID=A0A5P8E651_9BACT|nr:4Fe-4S dicluster domain-containing protein [Pseudoprevotella muciniphila]